MSESSKMGLLGSKENKSTKQESNKEESPERYAPYSADSDSETYDTEALSIMDINDIIGVQSEPVGDSTLESEFAALSEIITDSKPVSTSANTESTPTNLDDDKISKELGDKIDNISDATKNTCAKIQNQVSNEESDVYDADRPVSGAEVIEKVRNETSGATEEKIEHSDRDCKEKNKDGNKKYGDADESSGKKCIDLGINKSLQLIGEAYTSDDSQESDPDELQIGKEPRIVFSCKPLVDKHQSFVDSNEINENISIDTPVDASSDSKGEDLTDDRPSEDTKVAEDTSLQNDNAKVKKVDDVLADDSSKEVSEKLPDETDNNEMDIDDDELCKEEKADIELEDCVAKNEHVPSLGTTVQPVEDRKLDVGDEKYKNERVVIEAEDSNELSVEVQKNEVNFSMDIEQMVVSTLEVQEDEKPEELKPDIKIPTSLDAEVELDKPVLKNKHEILEEVMEVDEEVDKIITKINEECDNNSEKSEESSVANKESVEVQKICPPDVEKTSIDVNDDENLKIEEAQLIPDSSIVENNKKDQAISEVNEVEEQKLSEVKEVKEQELSEIKEVNEQESSEVNEQDCPKIHLEDNTEFCDIDSVPESIDNLKQAAYLPSEMKLDLPLEENTETAVTVEAEQSLPLSKENTPEILVRNENPVKEQEAEEQMECENITIPVDKTEEKIEKKVELAEKSTEIPASPPAEINKSAESGESILSNPEDVIEGILESDKKVEVLANSETVSMKEELPTTVICNLAEELSSKSENLPDKIDLRESEEYLEDLLNLELIPNEEQSTKIDKPTENIELVLTENKKDLITPRTTSSAVVLPESERKVESDQATNVFNADVNNFDKSEPIPMDVDEIVHNDPLEAIIPDVDTKTVNEISVKSKEHVEELVKEPVDEFVKEPVEELVKEPVEELVKEPVEELIKEPVEELVNESVEELVKVPVEDILQSNTSLAQEKLDIPIKSPEDRMEVDTTDSLANVDSEVDTREIQPTPEISELEFAVKFLQQSEVDEVESPKITDSGLDSSQKEDSSLYSSSQDICEDSDDLVTELDSITNQDTIAISEAEIINEAAKLENERKQFNDAQTANQYLSENDSSEKKSNIPDIPHPSKAPLNEKESLKISDNEMKQAHNLIAMKTTIPKISILEERLKEPPKIEIPISEPKIGNILTSSKTSLLIQRDAKMANFHKMLDSPKISTEKREELKSSDSHKKDTEKHDFDNVGSPRIILKIAKSAIAECAEPRSPKSPKIRSATNSPNPEDSPGQKLGKIKLKLSKGCHPAIINENNDEPSLQWHTESSSSLSPLGMKIKLSKSGDASIIQSEKFDNLEDRRLDSPLGMKIKLSKSGDASIIQNEAKDIKHKADLLPGSPKRTESPLGVKIKLSKTGDASIIQDKQEIEKQDKEKGKEKIDLNQESKRSTDSPLGVKIKLFKTGDASILPTDHEDGGKIKEKVDSKENLKADSLKIKLSKKGGIVTPDIGSTDKDRLEIPEVPKRTESPLGMKIKLSKTGDASIIYSEVSNEHDKDETESSEISSSESSSSKDTESNTESENKCDSSIGMKIKLSKDGDATIVHREKQDDEDVKRFDSLGMKIKFSKSGDASIIQPPASEIEENPTAIESMKIKLSKSGHPTIVVNDSDVLPSKELPIFQKEYDDSPEMIIQPVRFKKQDCEATKRKDLTIAPVELKKSKLENQLKQILPEVTIQPVVLRQDFLMNSEIDQDSDNQEVSITQVNIKTPIDNAVGERLKNILIQPSNQNSSDDCEIIEHHPELIIVNENSNSSQDVMIIDEVSPVRVPEIKLPKKRGRPRRIPIPPPLELPQDPLALDDHHIEPRENERPKRTCRSLKSYAPPKRGRGRGRGKRKFDRLELPKAKRPRLERNFTEIEKSTTALITIDEEPVSAVQNESPELYKALKQPSKSSVKEKVTQNPVRCTVNLSDSNVDALIDSRVVTRIENDTTVSPKSSQIRVVAERLTRAAENIKELKDSFNRDHQNWLTPASKRIESRNDGISMQVLDEETRMSAESLSRSQTPAKNIPASETPINEESQGSVVSTATTESEKVKVKNRRMEINFDPDEGPFTVDKIAEYEWPPERKGETFMLQEQISQYLGVKSFKRKYPELKRRIVDMEERNYLRENALVNESMCDMGLTAICSSEVLDIMCSDFPDHYEEYRKHMRERQIKEHSKKQKELTAAATAEKNRIDLAEMAVQSAVSWNVNLNKARRETRKCSLDLQTFTIHVPKKQQKINNDESKVSHYPVALIPGQYTDYYREYTPAELRYYPLNTVLYGPMRPNERKFDSQSEGSQSDSDSDSSSDDSSCSSSEGTQDTEESQSTMEDVDLELSNQKDKSLKCKMCFKNLNKLGKSEVLIQCGTCNGHVHPSCIDLTLDMVPHIQAYAWQCTDCKTCAQCHDPADEDKMLFCDMCDRGYHIYCVGLRRVPQGRWHCQECAICGSCGSREPGGINAERNSVAQWQHEYKKGDKNTRVYVSTLCVPCSKLWRKGRYCPHCSRCHTIQRLDLDETLVHCSACDKYLHLECVENKDLIVDKKNYQCEICTQNRQRTSKTSASKVIRA